MKKILGLALIVIAITMFSCGNKENEGMLKSVDSLFTAVKAIETKVLIMDTTDYTKRIVYSDDKLDFIQNNFTDTATREQAIFISDIVASKRSFSKLLKKREEVIDEILYSKGQLTDLKKDVSNNLILKNSFKEYYNVERETLKNLSVATDGMIRWGESSVKRHEKMKPQIEEFLDKIK